MNQKYVENEICELEQEIGAEESLKPIPLAELMAMEFKDTEWVVEQLVPAGSIVAISAAPATHKTWLVLDIAGTVAQGKILFNQFSTTQTGVLIVDEENGHRLLQKRFQKLQENYEIPVYVLPLKGFKLEEEKIEIIVAFAKASGIKLIIFDSLVRIHDEDENAATSMAKVFSLLKRFNKEGITVILTHHNRKQGLARSNPSQDMRGSSDIFASVDCHLAVEKKDDFLLITQTKLRQEEEVKPFKLQIVSDENEQKYVYAGEVDEVQNKKEEFKEAICRILEQENKPMYKKEISDILKQAGISGGFSTFKMAVKEMVKDGVLIEKKGDKNKTYLSLKPFEDEQKLI